MPPNHKTTTQPLSPSQLKATSITQKKNKKNPRSHQQTHEATTQIHLTPHRQIYKANTHGPINTPTEEPLTLSSANPQKKPLTFPSANPQSNLSHSRQQFHLALTHAPISKLTKQRLTLPSANPQKIHSHLHQQISKASTDDLTNKATKQLLWLPASHTQSNHPRHHQQNQQSKLTHQTVNPQRRPEDQSTEHILQKCPLHRR